MNLRRIAVGLIAGSFLVGTGFAQTSKGTLAGVVRDTSGAVVPDARVTITDQQTKVSRVATSSGNGSFRIEGIDPDKYTVRVEKSGFSTTDSKDLVVVASQVTSFDPALSVGSADQTITVEASSNSVNTENGYLGGTVGQVAIEKLPVFSLNPISLAATVAGVSPVNQTLNLGGTAGNGTQIQSNGARPRANNFMLDGQDINDVGLGGQAFQPQIVDAFQSVSVLTNSTSAEYGRAGGVVVNTISKTGTNQFHGTVYDLYQGSGLNSIDGQTRKTAGAQKARYDQHSFGVLAGGPIFKNKLFAFGGTQFQRFYGNNQATSVVLPDAAGYAQLLAIPGAQSTLLQQYLSGGSYLSNYTVGPAGPAYNISARPGCTSGCAITTASFSRPPVAAKNPDTQWVIRVDYTPSSADTFTYRYLHDNSFLTPDLGTNTSGLPGFDNTQGGPSEIAQGGWTHVFTPNLINELRAGETRVAFAFAPLAATTAGPLGSAPNIIFAGSNGLPELGVDQNLPQGRSEDLYQIQDTLGWTKGRQSIRIGADLGRQLEKDLVSQNAFGSITYSARGTTATPALSPIDNFLNDRIGGSGVVTKSFGPTRIDPHVYKLAGFVQDDIKLSSELTINLGLRYDYISPGENSLPFPSIDTSNPFLPINTVLKVQADKNNLGPRAAFAFAPHSEGLFNGNTVIHGGFGVFYDTDFSNIAVNGAQSAPNSPTGNLTSTTRVPIDTPASTLLATLQPQLSPTNSVLSVSSRLRNPLTYQYNLGFERELPASLKMTVNYVGNRALKLYANQQYNYFNSNTGTRLNPARGAVTARVNDAVSNYNSIQVEVSRQFKHGFYLSSNYVFGKMLDNTSEIFSTFANPNTSYGANLAPGGRGTEYGNSSFDHRHFFSVAYVYSPAGFHSSSAIADGMLSAVTRHFTFSGVTQLQSGSYSSFQIAGLDTNGDGNAFNDRPLLSNKLASLQSIGIDGTYVGGTPGAYYDLAVNNTQVDADGNSILKPINASDAHFLIPSGGAELSTRGIGRNSFSNPGTTTWNFAAEKDIPVGKLVHLENGMFQLRVEGQNVFNHNDVGIVDTSLLDVGTTPYLNPENARVSTNRNVRGWIKFAF